MDLDLSRIASSHSNKTINMPDRDRVVRSQIKKNGVLPLSVEGPESLSSVLAKGTRKDVRIEMPKDELDLIEEENIPSTSRNLVDVEDSPKNLSIPKLSHGLGCNFREKKIRENRAKNCQIYKSGSQIDKMRHSDSSSDKENSSYDYNRELSPSRTNQERDLEAR